MAPVAPAAHVPSCTNLFQLPAVLKPHPVSASTSMLAPSTPHAMQIAPFSGLPLLPNWLAPFLSFPNRPVTSRPDTNILPAHVLLLHTDTPHTCHCCPGYPPRSKPPPQTSFPQMHPSPSQVPSLPACTYTQRRLPANQLLPYAPDWAIPRASPSSSRQSTLRTSRPSP